MKKLGVLAVSAILAVAALNAKNEPAKNEKTQGKEEVQTYSIKGSIFDTKDKEDISGATITIEGKKFYSDLSGNFSIVGLTKGKHTLTVDFVSYQTKSIVIDLSNNQELKIELLQQ